MIDIREYLDGDGRSPFGEWRSELNAEARGKVTTALYRVGLGNFSNVRGVGAGVFECKINFGPGYRVYFGKDGEKIVILAWRRNEETAGKGYPRGPGAMGGVQRAKKAAERRGLKMALTRDFRETVQADARRDPVFRRRLLSEALESLLGGEVALGKELLRDYINATVGFPKLAAGTKIHAKTLHQMFGARGNPTARKLFEIVVYLQRAEGVRFEVRSARATRSRAPRAGYREAKEMAGVTGRS